MSRSWRLGQSGVWLAATSVTFVGAGLLTGSAVITLLGGLPLLALLWATAIARVVGERLAHDGLRVGLEDTEGELRVHTNQPLTLPIRLGGPLAERLGDLRLVPGAVPPMAASVTCDDDGAWSLTLRCPRVGHAWLHGFFVEATAAAGLVVLRRWLPRPVQLTVLPRRFPLRGDAPLRATRASLQDRAGAGRSRRRGFGLEIRELRDHQPGDPFKHIAWAATARRGKLVTREFESNLMLSVWLLVDVSPSMFWGRPGSTRVDFAVETAYNLSSLLLSRGDRAGLMLYDEHVRLRLPPSSGRGQLFRLLDGLLEVPHLVHEDRTELTDRELVERVVAWFEAQEGLGFELPSSVPRLGGPRHTSHDERRLVEVVAQRLSERPRGPIPAGGYAPDADPALLRAFCRQVGIPVPLDPTPRPGAQARGLETAMQHVLAAGGGPHTLVVVSDLHTVDDLEALRRAALGARRHHHAVIVLCPADPAFEQVPDSPRSPLGDALLEVEQLRSSQNVATVEAILRPAGVTVLSCSPSDVMPRLLHRLDQVA